MIQNQKSQYNQFRDDTYRVQNTLYKQHQSLTQVEEGQWGGQSRAHPHVEGERLRGGAGGDELHAASDLHLEQRPVDDVAGVA